LSSTSAIEKELYLAPGGPTFRLMQRFGLVSVNDGMGLRRIVALILLTWVPMCLFALWQGAALTDVPRQSFLLDFATYARFFVALPMLVLAETIVGPRLRQAGLRFTSDEMVRPADMPAFAAAVARLARRRDSVTATLIIFALAAFGAWQLTAEAVSGISLNSWQALHFPPGHEYRYSLAALWNHLVAVPLLLFLAYRWLWRIVIWSLFLWDLSRLDLDLLPTHADRCGGLGFLEQAHSSFGCIAFGAGTVLSAQAAFRIIYEGAPLNTFQTPVLIVLVVMLILFLGPLLVFSPMLARARRAALIDYGALVVRHNRRFRREWIDNPKPPDNLLLGNPDMSSLADLGGGFRVIETMRVVPCGLGPVVQLTVAMLLPCLPLVLLVVPTADIIDALTKLVL